MDPAVNPYEAPRVADGKQVRLFKPCVMPRDWIDCALGITLGCGIAMPLLAAFVLLFYLLSLPIEMGVLVGAFTLLGVALGGCSLGIQKITVHDHGLELHRFFGMPRFVEWSQILGIRSASRTELVYAGLTPHRLCAMTLTFRDQLRIDWQHGHFYFPPRDPQAFMAAIQPPLEGRNGPPS